MKLSRTTRKDPTQSKSLRESYRRDLLRLFASYRRDALTALQQSAEAGSRMLSESRLDIVEDYYMLDVVNQDEIEHLEYEEYVAAAKWEHVKRTRYSTLVSADIDLIGLDETLRGLGAALVTKGAPITRDHVLANYTAGTGFGTKQLNRIGVEAVIGDGPADWRVIDSLKVRNLSALRGVTEEMNKQIIRELSDGIQKGESMPKLAKRISGRVDSIGKTRATIMARTETMTAFNQGAELRYAQAGVDTLEWLSAHDPPRVCEECLALDGTTFRVKSNHPRPPIHPNCRCTTIPVLGKPKLVSKEDSVRNLTNRIGITQEGATAARREFTSVRNWNSQWRDDIRTGMKLAPEQMHKAWTGKTASVADLKKMRIVLADAERRKAHFLTIQEIALTGKWGRNKGFSDKIAKEIALSGRLNRYDIELDDLLMELRAIKRGRHLGLDAAVKKYEKRIWNRPGEELYLIDKNGQKIYYASSAERGMAGFADVVGEARGGVLMMNQADGTHIMIDDYVRQAAKLNLAEVRMVADDRVHILRRTGKWDEKYYADTIAPAYRKAKRDLKKELVDAGKENRIGTEWYDWQAWKRAVIECDEIEYDRATPSPLIPRKKLAPHERDLLKAEKAMREEKRLKDFLAGLGGGT